MKLSGSLRKQLNLQKLWFLVFMPTNSKVIGSLKKQRYKFGNTLTFILYLNCTLFSHWLLYGATITTVLLEHSDLGLIHFTPTAFPIYGENMNVTVLPDL